MKRNGLGNVVECPLPNEAGADPTEVPFCISFKLAIEQTGHGQVEDAVAKELESLVVRKAVAAVGKGQSQEGLIPELVAQPTLKLGGAVNLMPPRRENCPENTSDPLNQTTTALPTRLRSGIKPQMRLSAELSRLSPIAK